MKRLTRRALAARADRRREATPTRHPVPQTRDGYVPPPPAEADRNRLVADLMKDAERQLARDTAEQARLHDLGNRIALLVALKAGTATMPGIHPKDRAAVIRDVLATTEDPMRLPAVVAEVAGKYARYRRALKASNQVARGLAAVFKRAGVTEQQGLYWVLNELIDRHQPRPGVHAAEGAELVGDNITRQGFHKLVAKADERLRRTRLLEQAQTAVQAAVDVWPDEAGSPARSVGTFAVVDPSAVLAAQERDRRGTRAFNPAKFKAFHEKT
jgi:hypothetical protein